MNIERSPYHPISCEFHDRLEDLATLRKAVRIDYRDESGMEQVRDAVITDVIARDGEEFVVLDSARHVRLDRLIEVDGARLSDYESSDSCGV
ncbi:hypothetical protein [Lysobacter changpingensis]|uniref:hypothetical protein n=1 Tax=Lysobacter changpingensis TaxID=2792784 RepID=UPI001A8BF5EE|nr:hypothetical protein [Lysobacter changpingensis]